MKPLSLKCIIFINVLLFYRNISLCKVQNDPKIHSQKLCGWGSDILNSSFYHLQMSQELYTKVLDELRVNLHYIGVISIHVDIGFDAKIRVVKIELGIIDPSNNCRT